ncbi:MAG: PAS domain-containing protein, partial [Solirubrobacteraceae bacterium]
MSTRAKPGAASARGRRARADLKVAPAPEPTEHEAIRVELALSTARLNDVERMAGVGSWELELCTGEITFSPGLARLLGLRDGAHLDLAGHLQRVHPDDRRLLTRCGEDCIRKGLGSCEYRIIRPGGEVRVLSLRAEMAARPRGASTAMRGAVLDVTDQRRAERERLSVGALFRQGFDAAQIGMSLSEPTVRGRCMRVNDAMCALLGRARDELLGTSLLASVAHPDDHADVDAARAGMVSGEASSFRAEHRFFRA